MRRARPWQWALAGLWLAGCILQPTEDEDCWMARACDDCLSRDGCGWCGTSNACVSGSAFGPDTAACDPSRWRFTNCGEPPNAVGDCAREDDCGGCVFTLGDEISDCVWCPATQSCASREQGCVEGRSHTVWETCDEADCAAAETCAECNARSCTWCPLSATCRRSSSCDYRVSSYEACPSPNACHTYASCDACVADADCGWCDDDWACVPRALSSDCFDGLRYTCF
ncbi:MAG TPA: hypothetical protein RMH99_31220 [Sandaracinaceae bacterium LLY-WYZ-13_1]|nr:hypothetical protein [Sandaracinaceae bacterium LLY-WYZ-13_1]